MESHRAHPMLQAGFWELCEEVKVETVKSMISKYISLSTTSDKIKYKITSSFHFYIRLFWFRSFTIRVWTWMRLCIRRRLRWLRLTFFSFICYKIILLRYFFLIAYFRRVFLFFRPLWLFLCSFSVVSFLFDPFFLELIFCLNFHWTLWGWIIWFWFIFLYFLSYYLSLILFLNFRNSIVELIIHFFKALKLRNIKVCIISFDSASDFFDDSL